MATQADIPADLTDNDKALIFRYLDAELNSRILFALLYGIYTGVLAVTLWNICELGISPTMASKLKSNGTLAVINKCWPIRRVMVAVIILLHALITISFTAKWSNTCSAFIENGKSFWTVFLKAGGASQVASWEVDIAASMSTILTDLYMIWYCWMVWGRHWLVILLPLFFLISATVCKIVEAYQQYFHTPLRIISTLYITFTLVTTLWCTLLIIYRILTVAGLSGRAEGRLRVYRHFIEVLVESSAFYSISLIVYLPLTIHNDFELLYIDVIAGIMKGIVTTLLVGRITTGHRARSDDSWQGSVIGSASIRSRSQERSRTSFREDDPISPMLDDDLEAQRESSVRKPSSTPHSVSVVADHAQANPHHQNLDRKIWCSST